MTTPFTDEQIDAAVKAVANEHAERGDACGPAGFARVARVALEAAGRLAPQAPNDIHEPNHDRVYCVRCGGNWPCQPAPVQPSSTVDEAALIREAKAEAWDEGHEAGWGSRDDDVSRGWVPSGIHESDAMNPYREGACAPTGSLEAERTIDQEREKQ